MSFSSEGWSLFGTERQYPTYKWMELARSADFLCRKILEIRPNENVVIYADGGRIDAKVAPDEIVIVVGDSGPGIPDVEKALQPGFSTAADWVRELGFGAGMGLNNIRNCVDEMELTSEVGVGTRLETRITLDRSAT